MEQGIVLTGIARSKGNAVGEALVNRQRMGWAFNHVVNPAAGGANRLPGNGIELMEDAALVVAKPLPGEHVGVRALQLKRGDTR